MCLRTDTNTLYIHDITGSQIHILKNFTPVKFYWLVLTGVKFSRPYRCFVIYFYDTLLYKNLMFTSLFESGLSRSFFDRFCINQGLKTA